MTWAASKTCGSLFHELQELIEVHLLKGPDFRSGAQLCTGRGLAMPLSTDQLGAPEAAQLPMENRRKDQVSQSRS